MIQQDRSFLNHAPLELLESHIAITDLQASVQPLDRLDGVLGNDTQVENLLIYGDMSSRISRCEQHFKV